MKPTVNGCLTAADLIRKIEAAELSQSRSRDLVSAVNRIAALLKVHPSRLDLDLANLRGSLERIRPAKNGISKKTYANIKSSFAAALALAGVTDPIPRGKAARNQDWGPLQRAVAHDKRLFSGLALFMNWASCNHIRPADVCNDTVGEFLQWLEGRTIYANSRDLVRRVPNLWNEARNLPKWPDTELTRLSFRAPSPNLAWEELPESLRRDSETYLALREDPDVFDQDVYAPTKPLAPSTLRQQREHIRLAASTLVRQGMSMNESTSLEDLVTPSALTAVLRYYYKKAASKPNAFAETLAKTFIQIARFYVRVSDEQLELLKGIARRLPSIPFDLTEKNKALLREFESEQICAKLLHLPEQLIAEVQSQMRRERVPLVMAQVAIAIDLLLVAPVRTQNLAQLNWRRHFSEPSGSDGGMRLYISAQETKGRKRDLVFDLPSDVARRLRWYRSRVLSQLNSDPDGDLFVRFDGVRKHQKTLSGQIIDMLEELLGIHMTPHQFRHLAAKLYLDERPEDFETVRALLGHAFAKTTLIYSGSNTQRASRAYATVVTDQREKLLKNRLRRNRQISRRAIRSAVSGRVV